MERSSWEANNSSQKIACLFKDIEVPLSPSQETGLYPHILVL